ncbi:hypothetical protein V8E53_010924 [Lactarius tabidus]
MSFISPEPQSRVFLDSHSKILLTKFDVQLAIIADRYLAFFRERSVIVIWVLCISLSLRLSGEELRHHTSIRYENSIKVQASLMPLSTLVPNQLRRERHGMKLEIVSKKGPTEADTDTQQVFVDILDNDVIKPLEMLKASEAPFVSAESSRVKEDLENSAAKYADHAENTIMKLQQAYLKKNNPRQYAHSTDGSQRPEDFSNRRFSSRFSNFFRGRQEETQGQEPAMSEEGLACLTHTLFITELVSELVFNDECRGAISLLNTLRSKRVENLKYGYDCVESLVFTPTVKNVLVRYMDGMVTTRTKYNSLAINARAGFENVLIGRDTSGLRASFGHALSLSIPPLTLYCNYCPEPYSDLIFGVPLLNLATSQDNVPKVIRTCIEEVERRGLDTHKIYSVGSIRDPEILQLRRRFESENSSSFTNADSIHSVAMLLKLYLRDLPEPLFMLSLADYRSYSQNRARYTENDCSVLRSKIRELHPLHKASLEAILHHLFRVAFRSDRNSMTLEALAAQFCYTILRGNAVVEGGVHKLVMEDLIQNARILFDEPLLLSSPTHLVETPSALSFGPFMSAVFSRSAVAQTVGSATRHRSALVDGTLTSTLSETTPERVIHDASGTPVVETEPTQVDSVPPTSSVADWRLPQLGLHQHLEEPLVPQSPPGSVGFSSTDFSFGSTSLVSSPGESPPSPTTSLQSAFATFSPSFSEGSEWS